jgi:hypothetical protein
MTVDTLPVPPLALGLALVTLSLLGALVLWLRGRRPAAPVSVDLLDPELLDEAEPPAVRALRAQVRALEEALENAGDNEPVRVVAPEVAPVVAPVVAPEWDAVRSYRRQVRLAVRAVAIGTSPDDDPQHAVARVAAAIERLDRPGLLARPALPEIFGRSVTPPAAASVPITRAPVVPAVVVAPEPELDDELDVVAHIQSVRAPDDGEVVLPVPPPASAEPRRGRRRQRHSAA